jgi:hypothetical protein
MVRGVGFARPACAKAQNGHVGFARTHERLIFFIYRVGHQVYCVKPRYKENWKIVLGTLNWIKF